MAAFLFAQSLAPRGASNTMPSLKIRKGGRAAPRLDHREGGGENFLARRKGGRYAQMQVRLLETSRRVHAQVSGGVKWGFDSESDRSPSGRPASG